MKKTLLITTLLCSLFVFGCTKHSGQQGDGFFYDNTLTVEGVYEDTTNHIMADKGVLVLNGYFEDHADHIYFSEGIWEKYFKNEREYLPGNSVKFMGDIKEIDAGAGNHYYEVVDIYKMGITGYPNQEDIESIIDGYNYCETESDCIDFNPGCSFGCSISVNLSYKDIAKKIIDNYNRLNKSSCTDECKSTIEMKCENNKCIALTEKPTITCTQEDREQKECSNNFEPVCGNDGVGYNNPCLACLSKYVSEYSIGGCEGISYFIEGTPKNLDYVLGILKKDGSVSCNMTYKFKGQDLKGKIFADKDRFFAIRDAYYDGKVYHDYSLLSVGGKRYEWLKELPTLKELYKFTFEIPDEIEGVLTATEIFDDFTIECHAGIDDENAFNIPSDVDFF